MTLSLTKKDLLSIVGGKSFDASDHVFSSVQYDSREIKGGELFIALKGATSHGHEFLNVARDRGASLFLVEDEGLAKTFSEPERLVCVKNTLKAFSTLATWWRRKLALPVLAITGSIGKTTTKEITASILLQHSRGAFSLKSYNNHVGVPYSICSIGKDHQWAVLEMGMNHAGEIRELTKIAEPSVATISCVAPSHIEMLGSLENIAKAKLEIIEGLSPTRNSLVVNGNDPVLCSELKKLDPKGLIIKAFGAGSGILPLDAEVSEVKGQGLSGITFKLRLGLESADIAMNIMGEHNAVNAACAALAAKTLLPDLTFDQVKKGLSSFTAPMQRLSVKEISGGRQIVDDAYNANPNSMKALFKIGAGLKAEGKRVGLILADMLELGEFSERYHREVGVAVRELAPEYLITVGEHAKWYAIDAKFPCHEAPTPEVAGLLALKLGFDVLLVKGSRGMKLERAVKVILDREGV